LKYTRVGKMLNEPYYQDYERLRARPRVLLALRRRRRLITQPPYVIFSGTLDRMLAQIPMNPYITTPPVHAKIPKVSNHSMWAMPATNHTAKPGKARDWKIVATTDRTGLGLHSQLGSPSFASRSRITRSSCEDSLTLPKIRQKGKRQALPSQRVAESKS